MISDALNWVMISNANSEASSVDEEDIADTWRYELKSP
jgi:hypothetical protein